MMRRRRLLSILGVVLVLSLALAGPAAAVTNGTPDGNAHPYVGLLIFTDGTGTGDARGACSPRPWC